MSVLIEQASILNSHGGFSTGQVLISGGRFSKYQAVDNILNFENDFLIPGFIDLQIYGGNQKLFADDPGEDSLKAMVQYSLEGGATTVLPTIATNTYDVMHAGIDAVRNYQESGLPSVAGLHLEGPFINPLKKGAHIESYIQKPALKKLKELLENGKGIIKIITLAPECCDKAVTDLIKSYDIKISIGHSNANFTEASDAFSNNLNLVTHLFNAMPAIHHRNPGLAVAAMMHPHTMASIVADGIHVNFNMIAFAKQIMKERLFLITDAVTDSKGVYPHQLEEEKYVLPDGTLSGSALTMLKAVQNCVHYAGIPFPEACRMASLYPARALGIDAAYGEIKEGFIADFLRIDPQYNLVAVYKSGRQVWPVQ